jgi:signal transduction histidine kinase
MFCEPYPDLVYLLFSAHAPALLYYSHFPAIIVSLFLSIFIFIKSRGELTGKILTAISVTFSLWSVMDLFIWTQIDSRLLIFLWSYWFFFFVLLFILSFYFLYVFAEKKDLPFKYKLTFLFFLLPIILLSSSSQNLTSFDVFSCNAIESTYMLIYAYILSSIIFISIVIFAFSKYYSVTIEEKKRVMYASIGICLFLLSFSIATYIASIFNLFQSSPDTFAIEQYGYFGMTIFIAFLAYIIVRFKAFNIKLIATQALIVTLVILIGSQFFFIRSNTNRILNGITFVLSLSVGVLIVRSVKREIKAKEALAIANARLKELDKQKSEFVSFATHQLRSPLTSILGNASLILEGDFGKIPDPMRGVINTILESTKTQINVVEDYLNISRIELGTMKYNFVEMDFKDLLKQIIDEQKPNIEAKGLTYTMTVNENENYKIKADPDKFKQVVMNTIDNSIKYTKQGSISISLEKDSKKSTGSGNFGVVRLKIVDTVVGITSDVLPKLFQKFSRAGNANEANIHGTGLGLYIAKEIMNAHGGRIWAESAGEGKGSQFYVEIPMVK